MTYREHMTNGNNCWCVPTYFVPCDECERGCWKCDGGKIWLTREQADAEERGIVIVHRDTDSEGVESLTDGSEGEE